ncbi:MAG: beta-phosphoglucomutase family hydrolase [Chloroflexi bacterium]|nr:beta-phosphoglucomutase family hydrolase [Chloroflexota bacterium]
MKLSFEWDGKEARAEFTPSEVHQGWQGIIHGGIIVSLLDEAMTYAALFEGNMCVTAELQARLKRPVPVNESLVVTASVVKRTKKLLTSRATLSSKGGDVVAEGTSTQFIAGPSDVRANPEAMSKNNEKAVLWDLDGVIVDTAPFHLKSWQNTFGKRGIKYTQEEFKRTFGQRNETIIPSVLGRPASEAEVKEIVDEKEASFRSMARKGAKPFPGAVALIKEMAQRGVKTALVTSTPVENIRLLLDALGIFDLFQVRISAEDVTEGKPSPQGFLLAAQKLAVKPGNCVVIEDAVAGVAAAKRAEMHCVAVTNTHPRRRLKEADLIVETLEELTVDKLLGLIRA